MTNETFVQSLRDGVKKDLDRTEQAAAHMPKIGSVEEREAMAKDVKSCRLLARKAKTAKTRETLSKLIGEAAEIAKRSELRAFPHGQFALASMGWATCGRVRRKLDEIERLVALADSHKEADFLPNILMEVLRAREILGALGIKCHNAKGDITTGHKLLDKKD